MFKNIMLPVDGSYFSELALPLAVQLAKAGGARLHIVRVHVVAGSTAEAAITANYDELVRDWERDGLAVARQRALDAGVEATAELLDGPVVAALQTYIAATDIDLVVMTTHGRSGIKRAVLGSVAEQCVRKTDRPILLIHPRSDRDLVTATVVGLKRILVPLDGTEESEAVLPHVVRLAHLTQASIVLTRIACAPFDIAVTIGPESLRDYLTRLREQAETYLLAVRHTLPADLEVKCVAEVSERATQGILHVADAEQVNMVAMATHGRSGWSRVAVGSVAETVLHKSTTPVLLVKGLLRGLQQTSIQSKADQLAPVVETELFHHA
jgi:nucleotide-binding universal stress UspA family protein